MFQIKNVTDIWPDIQFLELIKHQFSVILFFSSLLFRGKLGPVYKPLYSSSLNTVNVSTNADAWLAFCYRWRSHTHTHTHNQTHTLSFNRCWTVPLMESQWGGTMLANNNALFPLMHECAFTFRYTHTHTHTHRLVGISSAPWSSLIWLILQLTMFPLCWTNGHLC